MRPAPAGTRRVIGLIAATGLLLLVVALLLQTGPLPSGHAGGSWVTGVPQYFESLPTSTGGPRPVVMAKALANLKSLLGDVAPDMPLVDVVARAMSRADLYSLQTRSTLDDARKMEDDSAPIWLIAFKVRGDLGATEFVDQELRTTAIPTDANGGQAPMALGDYQRADGTTEAYVVVDGLSGDIVEQGMLGEAGRWGYDDVLAVPGDPTPTVDLSPPPENYMGGS